VIARFISEQEAAGRSPRTLHVYKRIYNDLRRFLLEQIQGEDIRQITKEVLESYSRRVCTYTFGAEEKRAWIARIKIFFRWIAQTGWILFDPAASIKLPAAKKRKYPVYLTQGEIAKLLHSVTVNAAQGVRDRAILELLYSSGLRSSEICNLTLADINFADGTVRVLAGKNKKDRLVPVGKIALSWLDRYIADVHGLRITGPLFYHFAGKTPLRYYNILQIVSKYKTLAGIKKRCNPRSFRHSFAIHLLENGASVRHIQAMMGHATLKTTQKYLRIVPQELKRVHQRSHPSNNRKWKLPESDPVRLREKE
jgi:integrase/recombinase XerD